MSEENTEDELEDLVESKSKSMVNMANFLSPKKSNQYFDL